jgi:hypothetical protein
MNYPVILRREDAEGSQIPNLRSFAVSLRSRLRMT